MSNGYRILDDWYREEDRVRKVVLVTNSWFSADSIVGADGETYQLQKIHGNSDGFYERYSPNAVVILEQVGHISWTPYWVEVEQ